MKTIIIQGCYSRIEDEIAGKYIFREQKSRKQIYYLANLGDSYVFDLADT